MVNARRLSLPTLIVLGSVFAGSGRAGATCESVLPHMAAAQPKRPVTATDLIQIRDVGETEPAAFGGASPFALSPDGTRVAFYVTRPDLAENRTCRALVLLDLAISTQPILLDRGGDNVLATNILYGVLNQSGIPSVITPRWAPDGRWLAYLRADHDVTRVWVTGVGMTAHPVTTASVDSEAVAWTEDGSGLVVASRPQLGRVAAAVAAEGRTGWLYDARIWPEDSVRPRLPADAPTVDTVWAVANGTSRPASAAESARLIADPVYGMPSDPTARSGKRRAWTALEAPSPYSMRRVRADFGDGITRICADPACAGRIVSLWWRDGRLYFLKRDGWNLETMALYRWSPRADRARLRWRTNDVLQGCVSARAGLVCTRENSLTPRSVVLIDPDSGRTRILLDLNPEFAAIRLPEVRRLHWTNAYGLQVWGDLVLPTGYRSGRPVPLVVVQYHSDGFLRGGTGDEYPIFLFAEHGMAVLSIERPPFIFIQHPELTNWTDLLAAGQKDWLERRSLLSAVMAGVDEAVRLGIADPAKLGITGLSDGATTVSFAMINTNRFSAAAASTCCLEPMTTMAFGGIGWSDYLHGIGYPSVTANDRTFWAPMSLAQNAQAIRTPLLLQAADSEYRLALEAFAALRENGKAVEMYVFPGEFHIKIEPAHRAAVFARNIDWFDFWLNQREDPNPAKAAQYRRWSAMRSGASRSMPSTAP